MALSLSLRKAAREGDVAFLKILVDSGGDLGEQDSYGRTPLMEAIKGGHQPMADILVHLMSAESLSLTDKQGDNVLHHIARCGHPWLSVWMDICTKCPGLDQQINNNKDGPMDVIRYLQKISNAHRELYYLLEGKKLKECVSEKGIHTYNLTITCVGHEGVGKTCLVTNLKNEKLPRGGPSATNFWNLDINYLDFDPYTKTRQILEKGGEAEIRRQRLRHIIMESKERTVASTGEILKVTEGQPGVLPTQKVKHDRSSYVKEYLSVDHAEQEELDEYKQFMDWLHVYKQYRGDWLKDMTRKATTEENIKAVRKFVVQYSSVLGKDLLCVMCSSLITKATRPWYRCVQCTDTNLCEHCYISGIRLDNDHRDNHTMISVEESCINCRGWIFGTATYEHILKPYVCLGCNHNLFVSELSRKKKPPTYFPGTYINPGQSDKMAAVLATTVKGETGPRGFISIYDFGGEKVFYNTHHCLLSSDMVYLLVFDVAMCLDPAREKAGFGRIEFWMGSIATYATEEEVNIALDEVRKRGPPILLFGSHLDEVQGTEEEKLKKFETVISKLKENPKMKTIIERHVHGIYPVSHMNDSSKNKELFDKIWDKIMEVAPLQSQWEKLIPGRWLDFELELMTKKADGCNVITFEELKCLNRKLIVPLKDDNDIKQFLGHVQLTGSMVVCGLLSCSPYLVLNFNVITHAFRSIITAPKFKTELNFLENLQWKKYQNSGILSVKFLRELWKKEKVQDLIDKDLILFAMETYGLLSKPFLDKEECDVDYYIVPSMLEEARPHGMIGVLSKPCTVKTSTFCIRFEQDFIPSAIWDKLLATCIHRFKPLTIPGRSNSSYIQRGFACLCIDYTWNLVMNCKGNELKMVMFREDKSKTKTPAGIGVNIRFIIEYLIKQILEMSHQSLLRYNTFIHCDYRFTDDDQMVKADEFLNASSLPCRGPDGVYILCPEDYGIWFDDSTKSVCKEKDTGLPVELQHRKPTPLELGRICKSVGLCYQVFFVELDCEMALIEQVMEEYRHLSLRSRMTRLFIKHCNQRPDIDYSHISHVMKRHGIDSVVLLDVVDNKQQEERIKDTPLSEADLCKIPTNRELSIIAEYINNGYFNLFLELGLSVQNIEKSELQYYQSHSYQVMYEDLLRKWIETNETHSSIKDVLLAMEECHMPWYDVSVALCSSGKGCRMM